jgi:hypothetical protein
LERRKTMTLFVLFVSVPAALFCCIALLHFQQEILKSEKTGLAAGRRVSLDRQDDATTSRDTCTPQGRGSAKGEVYQLEGADLGPFFVVRAGTAAIGRSSTPVTAITESLSSSERKIGTAL